VATTDATAAAFHELGRRGHQQSLEEATGSIRFDLVEGTRTDHWLVTLNKGALSVSRKNVDADCVIRTDKRVFDAMASGELNEMAAYLRGELTLEGNPELVVLIRRIFPIPVTPHPGQAPVGERAER
jgi:putative sterol carrier protein